MRTIHPITKKLNIDSFKKFDVQTMTEGLYRFYTSNYQNAETLPSPEQISKFPICFWKDEGQRIQGLSSFERGQFWNKDELEKIEVKNEQYLGDRGESYPVSTLIVHIKNRGYFSAEFAEHINIPVDEITLWLNSSSSF